LRIAIANTKKLNMTTSKFLTKMQRVADELAVVGPPVPEDERVSYVLTGLGLATTHWLLPLVLLPRQYP
jgi:hypothetical protein